MEHTMPLANNHISVDCVVFGFDGEQLKVLLVKRMGEESGEIFHDMKLPGSLIYQDEDLDGAAKRVLNELTGLKSVRLTQFKAFGSKDRTKNPKRPHEKPKRRSLAGTSHSVEGGPYRNHRLSVTGKDRSSSQ